MAGGPTVRYQGLSGNTTRHRAALLATPAKCAAFKVPIPKARTAAIIGSRRFLTLLPSAVVAATSPRFPAEIAALGLA